MSRPSGRGRLAAGMFAVLGGVAVVNLPITILLARTLDPSGYGTFQFLNRAVFIVVSVAQLGLPHALSWAMTRSDNEAERAGIYRFATRSSVASGSIAAIACSTVLVISDSYSPLTIAFTALLPLTNLLPAAIANAARGAGNLRVVARIRIVQVLTWALSIVLILGFWSLDVENALGALLLSQIISSGVALLQVRGTRDAFRRAINKLESGYIWSFARRVFLGHTVWSWNQYLDQVVIGIFLTKADVGIYAFASGLVLALNLLNNPLSSTAQPLIQQTSDNERGPLISRLLATTTLVVGVGAIAVSALTPAMVHFVVGDEYQGAILLVYILAFGAVLDAWNGSCHGVLIGAGYPQVSSKNAVMGLVANVSGWALLLPTLGVLGAAITSVLAHLVVTTLMVRSVSRAALRDMRPIGLLISTCRAIPGTPKALVSIVRRRVE